MNKKQKLNKLDELLLDKLISIMESDNDEELEGLSNLTVPMNFLKNNMVVAEKEKSTADDNIKKRLKEAEVRRAKNKSI